MLPPPIPYSILAISVLYYQRLCEEEIERDREDMLILWAGCHIAMYHFLSPKDHESIKHNIRSLKPKEKPTRCMGPTNQPYLQTAKLPAAVPLPKGKH